MDEKVKVLIREEEIKKRVLELAKNIEEDYKENGDLAIVGVLTGAVIFLSDLIRNISIDLEIDFVDISSYRSNTVSGVLSFDKDVQNDLTNKNVLVVEDIIDTGKTIKYLCKHLEEKGAKSVEICTLLSKPARRIEEVEIAYTGFEIEDKFVVGYGMDCANKYRNLNYVGYVE